MDERRPPDRGNLMREIAALYAKLALTNHRAGPPIGLAAEQEQLKRQISQLTKQLMAL